MLDASRRALLALAAAAALAGCDLGLGADADMVSGSQPRPIVNGQVTADFPTAGVLLAAGSPSALLCTGTLIGCDRFLTAAHCVCFGDGASCQATAPSAPMLVYLQNAGFFSVAGQHVHPDYSFPDSDVAVLELSRPVASVVPSPLSDATPALGQDATIVGFGRSGGAEEGYGIKQFGSVTIGECPPDIGEPGHVCWDFSGEGSNTCSGDSGGPLFVDDGSGQAAVAGITSGGTLSNCLSGDQSYDTDVFSVRDYVVASAGGAERLGQARCGDLPHLGEDGAAVSAQTGSLAARESVAYEIAVPAGTAELRASLNSTEGASHDMYMRAGEAATAAENDCAADGPASYGFCEIQSPAPGSWHLVVTGATAGTFQLTTTTLAGAPVAADDAYATGVDSPMTVAASDGVLANDTDAGRGALVAELVAEPQHGQLALGGDGSFTYTPSPAYSGDDSFRYRASDGAYSAIAEVVVTVAVAPLEADESDGADGGCLGCAAGGGGSPAGLVIGVALALGLARRRPRRRRRA